MLDVLDGFIQAATLIYESSELDPRLSAAGRGDVCGERTKIERWVSLNGCEHKVIGATFGPVGVR